MGKLLIQIRTTCVFESQRPKLSTNLIGNSFIYCYLVVLGMICLITIICYPNLIEGSTVVTIIMILSVVLMITRLSRIIIISRLFA